MLAEPKTKRARGPELGGMGHHLGLFGAAPPVSHLQQHLTGLGLDPAGVLVCVCVCNSCAQHSGGR